MTPMNYEAFEAISAELIQASAELDRVFQARGIADGDLPIFARSDEEAMSAVRRMQAVQARLNAWLESNVG